VTKPKKLPPGVYTAKISDVTLKEGALEIKAVVPAMDGKEITLQVSRIQKPKRRRR